jgi:HD-like signal output (HDOD) protein/CheY-like chemotaxis protein
VRILFVDDEDRVLAGIERTLFMTDRDWDLDFAHSGAEALEKLADTPADVVVSDMRMPLMDGAQLLRQVRDNWPRTIRIVLSGYTEQEAALRALDVAHQFLSKPCSSDNIIEAIDRAENLQGLLHDATIQGIVGRIGRLPAAPRMYIRLTELLTDENAHIEQVGETIRSDPALAAKALQLANSAFFRGARSITDIEDAVERIGLNMLGKLVLANEVFGDGNRPEIDRLRLNAVRASRLASAICAPFAPAETATTAALLATVGRLLPGIDKLCADADTEGSGFPTHVEVGAYLLGVWGLPPTIVEAVAHHSNPGRLNHGTFDAVGVVHVAVSLVNGTPVDEAYLQKMDVAGHLPQWTETYRQQSEDSETT